jgi:hypothetical protein
LRRCCVPESLKAQSLWLEASSTPNNDPSENERFSISGDDRKTG